MKTNTVTLGAKELDELEYKIVKLLTDSGMSNVAIVDFLYDLRNSYWDALDAEHKVDRA